MSIQRTPVSSDVPIPSTEQMITIFGQNYTEADRAVIEGAAKAVNESGITPDTGKQIEANKQAAAEAKAAANQADTKADSALNTAEDAKTIAEGAASEAGGADEKAQQAITAANEAKSLAEGNKTEIDKADGDLVGRNDTATKMLNGLVKQMPYLEAPLPIPNPSEATLAQVAEKQNEVILYLIALNRLQEGSGQMEPES